MGEKKWDFVIVENPSAEKKLKEEIKKHPGARAPRWEVVPARRSWRGPSRRGGDPAQP